MTNAAASLSSSQATSSAANAPHSSTETGKRAESTHNGRVWTWLYNLVTSILTLFRQLISAVIETTYFAFDYLSSNDPEVTRKYGHGVPNWGNDCYLISSLQAIRSHQLVEHLPKENVSRQIRRRRNYVQKLCTTLSQRELTRAEIERFKNVCFDQGFARESADSPVIPKGQRRTQHDAEQLLLFLLGWLKVPQFPAHLISHHDLPEDAVIKLKPKDAGTVRYSTLSLDISQAKENASTATLVTENDIIEDLEKRDVAKDKLSACPENLQQAFAENKPTPPFPLPIQQEYQLSAKSCPPILPIILKRFHFDRETETTAKIAKAIIPSQFIDIALFESKAGQKKVRYQWSGTITHSGKEVHSGHYYYYSNPTTATPKGAQRVQYLLFNDDSVRLYTNSHETRPSLYASCINDINKNGYIHFYRFDKFVNS